MLDEISGGRAEWKEVLRQFWDHFSLAIAGTKDLTITQVLDALDTELGPHFFPEDGSGRDPRVCPNCGAGRLSLKLGKFGAFIGCSNYPECRFTRPLAVEGQGDGEAGAPADMGPRVLGDDPVTSLPVSVRKGPYGSYIQLGEAVAEGENPKRVSLPKGIKPAEVGLDIALGLLSLPRDIGTHPETGEMIIAGIGKFGPYIKLGKTFKSITADDDVLTIGINRSVSLLAEPSKGSRGAPTPLKTLGEHPADQAPVQVFKGRYGPYVAHDGVYASLPRDADPETFPLDKALELLALQKAKPKTGKSKSSAKPAPKKAAAKPKVVKTDDGAAPKKAVAAKKKSPAKKAAVKKAPAAKKVANA